MSEYDEAYGKLIENRLVSAQEAARMVRSGDRVVLPVMGKPRHFGLELAARRAELKNVVVFSYWSEDYPWFQPGWEDSFLIRDPFALRYTRAGVAEKRFDWVPNILGLNDGARQSEPARGRTVHHADVFALTLSPPNGEGYCSFGHYPWYSPGALRTARLKIAQIDPALPWVFGDNVHVSELDYFMDSPPLDEQVKGSDSLPASSQDDWEKGQVVGATIANELIRDGDVLEIGTGTLSEAVLDFLDTKNDLGFDSEMIYPQVLELVQKGVASGKRRNRDTGTVTTTALMLYGMPGDTEALEYIRENPGFQFRDVSWLCSIPRIASNDNMVSVNSAVAIDLLGQAVIDHLGPTPISGPGGQVEYCIGSHYSRGGRSVTTLLSTAGGGTLSRIVPRLEPGTVVEVPLTYVDYLITEHGVANLDCKSRRERAEAIIEVAHPDFRPELRKAARELFWP